MIFAAPLALAALALLPALYFILRLTPPAPRRLRFPPIALLRDLPDTEPTPNRLPLWMLLLRLLAAALLIIGFAGPTLRPPPALPGTGPVLLVIDNGWAAAASWPQLIAAAQRIIAAAQAQNRGVALLATARDATNAPLALPDVTDAATAAHRLAALQPQPWPGDRPAAAAVLRSAPERTRFYLADGIRGDDFPAFLQALHPTRILSPFTLPPLLGPPTLSAQWRPHRARHFQSRRPARARGNRHRRRPRPAIFRLLRQCRFSPCRPACKTASPGWSWPASPPPAAPPSPIPPCTPPWPGSTRAAPTPKRPFSAHSIICAAPSRPPPASPPARCAQLIAAHPGLIFLTDTPLSAAEQDAAPALCRGRRHAGPLRRAADRRHAGQL